MLNTLKFETPTLNIYSLKNRIGPYKIVKLVDEFVNTSINVGMYYYQTPSLLKICI